MSAFRHFIDTPICLFIVTPVHSAPQPVAEGGPLFVIYPMLDHPELRTQAYFDRTVWQVSRISLE